MNIVLLTNIPSPFMVEFASAVNNKGGRLDVCFCKDSLEDRGPHWRDGTAGLNFVRFYRVAQSPRLDEWILQQLCEFRPDVVVLGFQRGPVFRAAVKQKNRHGYRLGIWSEPPPLEWPHRLIFNRVRGAIFRHLWRGRIDFALSIGERAEIFHRQILRPENFRVFYFPYIQRLPEPVGERLPASKMRFLFSGRLLPRNNIDLICRAIQKLAGTHPGRFDFCFSANGPEEAVIERYRRRDSSFREHIHFDRDFGTWEDRLAPFRNADVLVVPAAYSGWGLVVSEALSLGLPVIATRQVEAARFFVRHMENGIFIRPREAELYHAMRYCVENPLAIERMSARARRITQTYGVEWGADRFLEIMTLIRALPPVKALRPSGPAGWFASST